MTLPKGGDDLCNTRFRFFPLLPNAFVLKALIATKIRTRSPTLVIPSSFSAEWSHSSSVSPVMLFPGQFVNNFSPPPPPPLLGVRRRKKPTLENTVVLLASDAPQPLHHLSLIPRAMFPRVSKFLDLEAFSQVAAVPYVIRLALPSLRELGICW